MALMNKCSYFILKTKSILNASSFIKRCLCHPTNEFSNNYDLIVIGGGINGTSSAREILIRHPHLKVAILEKETQLAQHQSSHNSGVVHAGMYYKPDTPKARLCVQGLHLIYEYCNEKGIPYKKCGKLIVATNKNELKHLLHFYKRGLSNKVPDLQLIDENKIREIEPYCRGIQAIWSPQTGIIDWGTVTEYYGKDFTNAGGDIHYNFEVIKFEETFGDSSVEYPITVLGSKNQRIMGRNVLSCAGLYSDILAELTGCSKEPRIVPFRAEYQLLAKDKCHMINGNIYAVPDPQNFPSLGVHFTPRLDGNVYLGPNAVLALKREGYKRTDIDGYDVFDAFSYPGFPKMAFKHIGFGLKEMYKSVFSPMQVHALQKYVPEIQESDVLEGPTGVRAQALDLDGNFVDDMVFDKGIGNSVLAKQVLHCRSTLSTGATSSLAIAKVVANKVENELNI